MKNLFNAFWTTKILCSKSVYASRLFCNKRLHHFAISFSLYNLFSPVISGTMFVQFLIIGIILGVTTIHIVLFANFFAIVASLFYVASILAETFPCSYLANSLMDDSDELSLAIFHSGWFNEEPRYKQVVVFFLQHTQKTLVLTAMKIFPITMNSNINVSMKMRT